ncbi:MAG TPA: hypothetical protein VJ256_02725, partial [Dehalococcoidia bacterium]|nr:hypothetical protein [Dehalococcoidia bacterium]
HLVGLVAALDRYRVGAAMDNGGRAESEAFLAYQRLIEQKGIRHWQAQAGQRVDLGGGARLEVLHPGSGHEEDINNSSVVLRLSLGQVAFLLTGDLEEEGEMALLQGGRPLKATVLKVPHHGSATSSSPPFLAAVRPALAVISAGRENSYGHPAPLTLQRLEAAREFVLRTDRQGTIEISTDGRRLWVRSRQPLCQRTPGCR